MKLSNWLFLGASAILVTACGSSDSGDSGGGTQQPAAQPGTVNKDVAKSSATQTITAATNVQTSNDGTSAAGQLQGAAAQAQGIIQPGAAAGGMPSALLGETLGSTGQFLGTQDGCKCDQAAKSCTFTDCTPSGSTNLTINGSLSWANNKVVATGLTYDVTETGAISNIHMTLDCDLTVGATQIDGSMHTTGDTAFDTSKVDGGAGGGAGLGNVSYAWSTTIKFNAVTYASGGGSPMGGSIDVSGSYSVKTGLGVGDQTYQGSSTVAFP